MNFQNVLKNFAPKQHFSEHTREVEQRGHHSLKMEREQRAIQLENVRGCTYKTICTAACDLVTSSLGNR